jgi:hypothetical protein
MNIDPSNPELPPEAIAFAGKMFDAARTGQIDVFQQALPAGLPATMTNDKGDSLVGSSSIYVEFPVIHSKFLDVTWILLSDPFSIYRGEIASC